MTVLDQIKQGFQNLLNEAVGTSVDGVSSLYANVVNTCKVNITEKQAKDGHFVLIDIVTDSPIVIADTRSLSTMQAMLQKQFPAVSIVFNYVQKEKDEIIPIVSVPKQEPIKGMRLPPIVLGKFINPALTFDNFIAGGSNVDAYQACKEIAINPRDKKRVILIHSRPALGKTHIVTAIANYIRDNIVDATLYFYKKNDFFDEALKQARARKTQQFIEKLEQVDVLIIDDVQMLFEKTSGFFLDLFYHILDVRTTMSEPRTTIFTSDKPLSKHIVPIVKKPEREEEVGTHFELTEVNDQWYKVPAARITTRVESGRMIEMGPPTVKIKEQYIMRSLESESLTLDLEDIEKIVFIASKGPEDFRSLNTLCNAIITDVQKGSAVGKVLSNVIAELVEHKGGENTAGLPGARNQEIRQTFLLSIVTDIAARGNTAVDSIITAKRVREPNTLFLRDLIFNILHEQLKCPYSEIAELFQVSKTLVAGRIPTFKELLTVDKKKAAFYEETLRALSMKEE